MAEFERDWATRLYQSKEGEFSEAYARYLDALFAQPVWVGSERSLGRFFWHDAKRASRVFPAIFDARGVYIHGIDSIPFYVGLTDRGKSKYSLGDRLVDQRYTGSPKTQYPLARAYRDRDGIRTGADALRKYEALRNLHSGKAPPTRHKHALICCQMDVERIWFAVLPLAEGDMTTRLEQRLIVEAAQYNSVRGLPRLLNDQLLPPDFNRWHTSGIAQALDWP